MWFNLMGWMPGPESETRKPAPSASSWIRRSSRSRYPGDLLSPEHVQGPGASLEGRLDRHITPASARCLATWVPTALASLTGTALPICRAMELRLPANWKSIGNV